MIERRIRLRQSKERATSKMLAASLRDVGVGPYDEDLAIAISETLSVPLVFLFCNGQSRRHCGDALAWSAL
jgi:hypothetical protein